MSTEEVFGYKTGVKTAAVMALKELYPESFAGEAGFKNVNISIEYPIERGHYPAIMVEFRELGLEATTLGDGAIERTDEDDVFNIVERWKFDGTLVFSFYAMKAKNRDLLSDGFIKAIGMGRDTFKKRLWDNPYIGITANTKKITSGGEGTNPGTPWGSEELTYFSSYSIDVEGEFFTNPATAGIIERVEVQALLGDEQSTFDDSQGDWQ